MVNKLIIRNAETLDGLSIALLAQKNNLLLDGLTPILFGRMLQWLYDDPPAGNKIQLVAQDSQKNIVAHYGGVPFQFQWGEKQVFGLLASNLVVSNDFKGQSPFLALQRNFAKAYLEYDYAFAYGAITRKGVLEPHLRMGWKLAGSLHVYIRPIAANKIFSKICKSPFFSKLLSPPLKFGQFIFDKAFISRSSTITIYPITKFDESWAQFLSCWMAEQDICAIRSPEVLNWRYCQFAERNYKILAAYKGLSPLGYIALRKMPMKGFTTIAITEVLAMKENSDVIKSLLREAMLYAQTTKVDLVTTALTDHDNLRRLLYKSGFIRTAERFSIVTHCPKYFLKEPISALFPRWRLNWFDHDYV